MNVNLLCAEAPFGERTDSNLAQVDENLTKDDRVMQNMLNLERGTIPRINYFVELQNDLLPFMRKVVTTWMLEVCEEQNCEEQVFPLAVNFMDRFLCECAIPRQQLQLVGATALLVSTKIRQCHNLTIHLLCAYTDHSVAPEEIKNMEILILTKLNWNPNAITGFDFVDHLLERMPWGHESRLTKRHAHTLVSVCCTEPEFMQTAPSILATACICAAVSGLNLRSAERALADLCAISRSDYTLAELMVCHIERVVANETAALQAPAHISSRSSKCPSPPCYYSEVPQPSIPKTNNLQTSTNVSSAGINSTHSTPVAFCADPNIPTYIYSDDFNHRMAEDCSSVITRNGSTYSEIEVDPPISVLPSSSISDHTHMSPVYVTPSHHIHNIMPISPISSDYTSARFTPKSPSSYLLEPTLLDYIPQKLAHSSTHPTNLSAFSSSPIGIHSSSCDSTLVAVPRSPTPKSPRLSTFGVVSVSNSRSNDVLQISKHSGKCGNTPTDVQNVDF